MPSQSCTKAKYFFRLTRIFHTHRDEEAAKADEVRQTKDFDAGLYVSYRSNQNSSPTQHSSAFPASTVDGYEICGLTAMRVRKSGDSVEKI